MMEATTLAFVDAAQAGPDRLGGKGINLVRLAAAGFPVPPGFVVTTDAYTRFVAAHALSSFIRAQLATIDYDDATGLESRTAAIRERIRALPLPDAIADDIARGYAALGDECFVAVRSSGTAEDLAGISFAGQHDTLLDIRGTTDVLDAVRACWASLWTARAVAYRARNGFDHLAVGIAVVVQRMIAADVAGVLFTANPMSAATDEFIVNASWGLGEAIVGGIVTPDLFVLDRDTLRVKRLVAGAKTLAVVRAPDGSGTTRVAVEPARRDMACLTDPQLAAIGELGRRVAAFHEGYPQDIEWAFAGGELFLLQSRDVTGVAFCWDEDLDDFQQLPKVDDTTWTRAWSDAIWTGAVTPFMYSFRCENGQYNRGFFSRLWNIDWGGGRRVYRYHRAFLYYNCRTDYTLLRDGVPPFLRRRELFENIPPAWRESILAEPFDWLRFGMIFVRVWWLAPEHLPWRCWAHNYAVIEREAESAHGLPAERIASLGDAELEAYARERIRAEPAYFQHYLDVFHLYVPLAMGLMHYIAERWLGENNPAYVARLLTGSPHESVTIRENQRLQALAREIAGSPLLRELFERHPGAAFFTAVAADPRTRGFHESYRRFVAEYGHRGHADRDIWFERRADNPALDHAALAAMLDVDFAAVEEKARAVVVQRATLTDDAIARLKRLRFGTLRARVFVMLQDWLLRFWAFRDDERAHADMITYSIRKAMLEVGRRLLERGLIQQPDDFLFLSKEELFLLFRSGRSNRLYREKIRARRHNHREFRKSYFAPMYLVGDRPADLDAGDTQATGDRTLQGNGTSGGRVSGIARIVPELGDIGKVKPGDILVTAATDPGWTSVFSVIAGLVLETGGMLSHGALLSREYGIPALQLPGAMRRIRDGERITVDGDSGQVLLADD